MTLILGNKSTNDILLKKELDFIISTGKMNLEVIYVIDHMENNWKGEVGHINKEIISKYVRLNKEIYTLICGPPGLCKSVIKIINDAGLKEENYHEF